MAITKIWGIKKTVNNAISYVTDEKKTDGKLLVTSHNCTAELADIEFSMTRETFDKDCGNLAFHLVQSFSHGELTEEVAHKIGNELLSRLDLENHKAVIATHIDKDHIHNHIIFNSVSDDGKRYYNNKKTYQELRKINDEICKEYKLSVIEKKENYKSKEKKPKVKIWKNQPDKINWRKVIKSDIDEAIRESKSFDSFINYLKKSKSYKIKTGKYLSFKPKDKERFVRDRSLGEEYSLEKILNRIELNKFGYRIETFENKSYKKYINKFKITTRKIYLPYYGSLYRFIRKNIIIYNTLFNRKKEKNYTPNYKSFNKNYDNIAKRVEQLSKQLLLIKKNNIKTYGEILEREKDLIAKGKDIETALQPLRKNDTLFKLIYEQLEINRKYLSVNQNKPRLFKKAYEEKYDYELRLFDNSNQVLTKYGLTDKEKILKFLDNYKGHVKKLDSLTYAKEAIHKDLVELFNLERSVKKLKEHEQEHKKEKNLNISKDFVR